MDLVFLHGPAAAGKLTIGRELARLTGLRLFHNHLVVDAVAAVFDFGTPSFIALREQLWLAVFREAAERSTSLIFTFAPERTVRPDFIDRTVATITGAGGRVRFIELSCAHAELERRIENASRAEFGKLRSLALFTTLAHSGAFDFPALPAPDLVIETSAVAPAEAARQIAALLAR